MIDSNGQTIQIGDTVEFKSTVDSSLKRGEVVKISETQTQHWRTKAKKVVQSIRVNYKNPKYYVKCSVFHKSTNLTVVKRPA